MFVRTITLCCLLTLVFGITLEENAERGRKKAKFVTIDDMIFPKEVSRAGVDAAWPNATIPFVIDASVEEYPTMLSYITTSMAEITRSTCINFRKKTVGDRYTSWVRYWMKRGAKGCSSWVGWAKIKDQLINLSPDCPYGTLLHETLHALGFLHEHTRDDRDDYVKVDYRNIQQTPTNYTHNYTKDKDTNYPRTSYYDVKYNYESIMHYGRTGNFAIDPNKDTITPMRNSNSIGNSNNMLQRKALSAGDIQMINNKYGCVSIN